MFFANTEKRLLSLNTLTLSSEVGLINFYIMHKIKILVGYILLICIQNILLFLGWSEKTGKEESLMSAFADLGSYEADTNPLFIY